MHLPYYTLLVYKPVISISAEVNELFSLHPQVSLFTLLYHQGLLVAAAAKKLFQVQRNNMSVYSLATALSWTHTIKNILHKNNFT